MNTRFKYKGVILETPNLKKKLKRMGITINDIEILPEEKKIIEEEKVEEDRKVLYHFKNPKTGETITSIYSNLDDLKKFINVNDYVLLCES